MTSEWSAQQAGGGVYAHLNGLDMYYETHGTGRPMVLIHGGLGSGEMMGPIIPLLAKDHSLIVPVSPGSRADGRYRPPARHPPHGR